MSPKPLDSTVTRRGLLKYLASAGAGLLWVVRTVLPASLRISDARAASTAFLPDAGYGFSGTPAFDSTFTITNASNPFGATGPTLVLFDDFRNGISGNAIPDNTAPVAGTATWRRTSSTPVLWGGNNRRGSGNAYRFTNNEVPGKGITYPRAMTVPLGASASITAVYFFYAENWHGWNGLNTSKGGGYYKHNWLELNGFAGNAFNMVIPDFIDQGTPSPFAPNVNLYFQGNDTPYLPQWLLAGQSTGFDLWDHNNWNSLECAYVGNPNDPTSSPGRQYMALYNASHGRAINFTNTSQVLFSNTPGSAGIRSAADHLLIPGLLQSVPATTIDRADFYIAVGPNCLNRFFIGDASTLATCTTIMPCTINSWSADSVTMTLRQGAFASPSGNHLYWSDASNNISHVGQFGGAPEAPTGVAVK